MISRSSRRAACGLPAAGCAADSSASRFRPSGVHSNTQANASAGTKPTASATTTARATHAGTSNSGSTVALTCTSSQAPTRYRPAARRTLRRLSSSNQFPATRRRPVAAPLRTPAYLTTSAAPARADKKTRIDRQTSRVGGIKLGDTPVGAS